MILAYKDAKFVAEQASRIYAERFPTRQHSGGTFIADIARPWFEIGNLLPGNECGSNGRVTGGDLASQITQLSENHLPAHLFGDEDYHPNHLRGYHRIEMLGEFQQVAFAETILALLGVGQMDVLIFSDRSRFRTAFNGRFVLDNPQEFHQHVGPANMPVVDPVEFEFGEVAEDPLEDLD
ncbi:hypothetical protein QAD02_007707 [Eretmocerus hayati]|uniref:Uncharacterized protein n=1 Tax=Eretmocerus hayati TaxID=131215 RepID=A0ACC2N8R8_9HYME|nr:hypothetical protein QAD02_007707 [Eretmocerus hayati]